jgi:hypothetical protein
MLLPSFQLDRLSQVVSSFGNMAQAFDALGNLDECSELRRA